MAANTHDVSPTIVKVGGARLIQESDLLALAEYLTAARKRGEAVVLVHGGGPEINAWHERIGVAWEKRDGLRVTSDEGMDVTTMVLCGLVNKRVVAALTAHGLPAVGMAGVDGGLLQAEFMDRERWGRVGTRPRVKVPVLDALLAADMLPVVAPVSLGADGAPVNVNADEAATALAQALHARSVDFVSDVPGVRGENDQVASRIGIERMRALIERQIIRGGMLPKIEAALAAVRHGVGRARIGDLNAMNDGTATEVVVDEEVKAA